VYRTVPITTQHQDQMADAVPESLRYFSILCYAHSHGGTSDLPVQSGYPSDAAASRTNVYWQGDSSILLVACAVLLPLQRTTLDTLLFCFGAR
jgi:hypothetical protein